MLIEVAGGHTTAMQARPWQASRILTRCKGRAPNRAHRVSVIHVPYGAVEFPATRSTWSRRARVAWVLASLDCQSATR